MNVTLRRVAIPLLNAAAVATAIPSAYLLGLLGAAAAGARRPPPPAEGPLPRLAVVVPAHDEEAGIGAAVASLQDAGCTPIVIADNCTDATAERARAAGATVWERHDDARRGKGHALAWAFQRLPPDVDAVAVVDADCTASRNLLRAVGARIAAGARAVQSSYVVANPGASSTAAARYAGFALINHVRPLGKSTLGLSCGLLGTGMAFDSKLLRDVPWDAFAVTEDSQYHARLVAAGERVQFAPEACVASEMPTSREAAAVQRERWESGGFELTRTAAPRLVAAGLRARDPNRVHAGLELLVPPQSLLMAAGATVAVAGAVAGARTGGRVAAAGVLAQIAFVLGGLKLVGAPPVVYRALVSAPLLAARNVVLYSRLARGRGPDRFIRTPR